MLGRRRDPVGVLMLAKGLGRGGAERLLTGMVRHIDRSRFRVEVAYMLPWKDAFVTEIEATGVPVHCLDARRAISLGWVGRLRDLVRSHDIRLVHTHMPLSAAMARLALRGTGGPAMLHTEHNLWGRYPRPTRCANALTYGRNARVIAVSGSVAASIRSRRPVHTVVHGIDIAALRHGPNAKAQARRTLGLPNHVTVVGTVGNFTAKKDHTTMLRAFADVKREHRGARLVLVGIGPLENMLRGQAQELHLSDAVLFTGMRDDVYDLLPAFDVFVLSSRFEGLPIAMLEAMGSGVPPVATRVGGIPEVITHDQNGLLVEPNDAAELAGSVTKLLADDAMRSRFAASARVRATDFDLASAVRTIEDIYDTAIGRTARPDTAPPVTTVREGSWGSST